MAEGTSELEDFSNLSLSEKSKRITSSRGILKRIRQNSKSQPHVVYLICKRLFRGLGASNPFLRQGCFSSIVGFLTFLSPDFDLSLIESVIDSELSPAGNNSKLEEGEAYLGQCLAYGAIIASDYILCKTEEEQDAVFQKLFVLSQKRSYLHNVSFTFLNLFLKKTNRELKPDGFVDNLRDLSTYTLDKLVYLVTLVEILPKTQTIKKVLGTKRLYDESNGVKIAGLIKKNKSVKSLEHEFYPTFILNALKHDAFLEAFWDSITEGKIVESNLSKHKSSHDLFILSLGSLILKYSVTGTNSTAPSYILNDHFLNIILRNTKKEKKLIRGLLTDFCKSIDLGDDTRKLTLIRHILFEKGLLNFDSLTNSKTIFTLISSLSFSAIEKLVDDYKAVLEHKREICNNEIESKNKCSIICLNFLAKLINHPVCANETNWRLSQLIYLLNFGFFKIVEQQFNKEVLQNFQEAFLTSLGHRFPSLEQFQCVLDGLVREMSKMIQDQGVNHITKFTDEIAATWKAALNLSKKMEKYSEKNQSHKEIIVVLKIIVQYMAILLFKEPNTAMMNIKDLKDIFGELTEGNEKDETMWIRVLIDLFLNLLSKPNFHHRHIIKCTFKFICPHLTPEAFLQIVDVLNLSYESEEVDEEDENETEKADESSGSENEEESSISDDEDEMDDDDDMSNNEKLRLELGQALGTGSDTESIDLDQMDLDEGKKLDETLSSIFRANVRKRKTNNLSKYQNQLAHFRTRVMDLLEICTEVTLPLSFWLKALLPMIDLYGSTVGQNKLDCLKSRIHCCIKKLNSVKVKLEDTNVTEISSVLENLLYKVGKSSGFYADMKNEILQVIKFLLKASKPLISGLKPTEYIENEIYLRVFKSLKNIFDGKDSPPLQLFTGLVSIIWNGIIPMIPEIVKNSFSDEWKPHHKTYGLQIIGTFVKTPQYFDGHLNNLIEVFLPKIKEILTESTVNEINNICRSKEIKPKYHSEMWSLLYVILSRQNNGSIPPFIDTEAVKHSLNSNLTLFPPFKNECKQHFKKLCNLLNVNIQGASNNTIQDVSEAKVKASLLKRKKKSDLITKKKKKLKTTTLVS